MSNLSSILIIYTGGTIGMKMDPVEGDLRPFDFSQISEAVPELNKFAVNIDSYTFTPLIDSSDVQPAFWQDLARLIVSRWDAYDGFVILHGTDTMAFSASALSFMLGNLSKPVIFTGSQLPIGVPRTDGRENLISSVEIAAARDSKGGAMVPEVCIYFDSKLFRGNRTTKVSAEDFRAFSSPNLPPLAEAGINIRYAEDLIRREAPAGSSPVLYSELDTRVSILKIHPGITPHIVRTILNGPETRAVILETYGSGNAPTQPWFLEAVTEAARDKILVNVTQCLSGNVDMSIYATGRAMEKAGVISGADSTTESMLAKLFVLMGLSKDNEWVKKQLSTNLRGEITQ